MVSRLLGSIALALALVAGCASEQKESSTDKRFVDLHIQESEHATAEPTHAQPEPYYERDVHVVKTTPQPTPARTDGLYWTERAYPTGDKRTSVVVLESGTPGEVSVGVPYEYILRVTNVSDMHLDNVVVLDKPRGNFELRRSDPKAMSSDPLRWEIGSLRPNEAKEIHVSGAAIGEGQVVHCAEVDWSSIFCSTTQVVKPGLALTMTATSATLVCDPITYSVTVSNNGSGTTRNIVIEERLPNGVESIDGKNTVQFSVPALEPGQSKTYSWKAKAKNTGRFTGVASAKADGGLAAQSGEVSTTVTRPVLVIEKTGTKQSYMGRSISYEMVLRNTGDGEARDVVVNDPVPSGTKFVSASDGAKLDGNVVSWNFGTMAPGASKTFSMKLSAGDAARVRSTATAKAYCADAVTAMAETDVTGISASLLEVIDLSDPIEVGDTTTYEIIVTNQGSAPDTNIRIAVTLEDTMGFVSATGQTKAEQTGQTVVFTPLASLAPGDKATWRVEVKALGTGDVRIKVAMNSDQLGRSVDESESTKFYK